MRVFLAGASGAIGRRLVPQLLEAGHEVTGMTRSAESAERIRALGAGAAVCDVFDREQLDTAMREAAPEAVIHQLTALPEDFDIRKIDYEPTNRVRTEGTRNLIDASVAAGTRRMVAQSIAFMYAPEGGTIKDEGDRPFADAPAPFDSGVKATLNMEEQVTGTPGLEGLVLRYGQFYGPGTYYAHHGNLAEETRKRRQPIVGGGTGVFSFIHVDDAAAATVAAIERGTPGIYNVVDDDPAAMREWVPVYAEALGAKPPLRLPKWVGRLAAGSFAVSMATELRGASNAKAKRELGWQPRYASWRDGFREALG
ncbi:MAG TPA: NAD(P)-dependent oxidoreductase [Thermoleophilaceae bacterium]|nr:NAD(P)-dependent oxidoreductase [Thermoleophilaceae bacterium]